MSGSSEDQDLLAGEYVLGVLSGAEMQAVASRAALDPLLAARIADWEQRLAPLALLVAPVAPPAAVWERLQQSLNATAANENRPRPGRAAAPWRTTAIVAMAVAAALAGVIVSHRAVPAVTVAALSPTGLGAPGFFARLLPDGRMRIAAVSPRPVPSGRDLELWALPAGAARPVSLGVLPATGRLIAVGPALVAGGQLLVSLEPKGGSPTGQPTGPVIYGGVIAKL